MPGKRSRTPPRKRSKDSKCTNNEIRFLVFIILLIIFYVKMMM